MTLKRMLLFYTNNHVRALSYWKIRHWYASLLKPRAIPPPYGHVVQIGDPRLRLTAEPVAVDCINSPEIQTLIACMKYVFKKYKCVGLSAPQVGIALRVIIFEFSQTHSKVFNKEELKFKEIGFVPFTIVINPEIKITDYNKVTFSETCESIRGYSGDVPRYKSLQLSGVNEHGEEISLQASGWIARIIQHELDHLSGKLYTDIMNRKSFTCTCWQAVNERRGKVVLPYYPE